MTAERLFAGAQIQNVFHIRSTNIGSIPDTVALGDLADIMDAWYTLVNAHIADDVSYDQVRVQNVTQDTLMGSAAWPVLTSGAHADDALPETVAALITMPTAKPNTRGGVYLGVLTESANGVAGAINAGTVTALASFGAQLLLEQVFGTSSYRYVVYNSLLKTYVLPTVALIHARWRTQRRRRLGVGS